MPSRDSSNPASTSNPMVRIAPYHYVHVLNLNTHVTTLLLGPKVYVTRDDEKIVLGPEKMISIPYSHYCRIRNPIQRTEDGQPMIDAAGQAKLLLGDLDYRFAQDPFPLYPGEELDLKVTKLPVIGINKAYRLRALVDFVDAAGVKRLAGEEWMCPGPCVYLPCKEVTDIETVSATMIKPNTALCLRATRNFTDHNGLARFYGEEWLIKKPGVYLPNAYEEIVETREAHVLTEKRAIEVTALTSHIDEFGKKRKAGDEWLITYEDTESHIISVHERLVNVIDVTTLNQHQYCVICNPVDDNGIPQLGRLKVVRGETSFFLKPGEKLHCGVQEAYILHETEGLIIRALEKFVDKVDGNEVVRQPGDTWILHGPMEYVPPIEVEVSAKRELIALDKNEGIYVRNLKTGRVRAVIGQAYMLDQDEELWYKKMPEEVVRMLAQNKDPLADRGVRDAGSNDSGNKLDLSRVVTFQVPHNAAVQVYDYREKHARVEFGPNLVMLGPDEQFTRLSLSGGKPKRPNVIKCFCLLLGPDFCTDVIVVETADHARLSLQLSYNWYFDIKPDAPTTESAKLFTVPDFVGDACKSIASRIRGTVAGVKFDDFHKNSARIIRSSVFGAVDGKIQDSLKFPQNLLIISSVDVQSVEPIDQRTRDALQKSVQLAIEITTNSQEATARHEAERLEQEARGRLERQRIEDEAAAEQAKRALLEIRVQLSALESTGQAKAEAQSRAEAAHIEAEAAIEQAKLRAEAMSIETTAELERLQSARSAELKFIQEKNQLALANKQEESKIDTARFAAMVGSLGAETIRSIATAASDHNLRMLSALGLQSTLITDGTTPVNLLNTAKGLIGQLTNSDGVPPYKKRGTIITEPRDDDDGASMDS